MRNSGLILYRCALVWLFAPFALAQSWAIQPSGTSASLRGISVVSSKVAWASGAGGAVLHTSDGGTSWRSAIVPDAESLDFRGVYAFDEDHAILMGSGEGPLSVLYETRDGGRTWTVLFRNPDPKGFFDSIAFADPQHGGLLGDPANGSFALFLTEDGGKHWRKLSLPPALPGEGAFAASNSSLVMRNCKRPAHCEIVFATGGPDAARVFHTADTVHWTVDTTPVRNDGPGAGIFSLALPPHGYAVAVGGDYKSPNESKATMALANAIHSGKPSQWTAPKGTLPRGYRSSVAYLADRNMFLATGPTGSELSRDEGQNWTHFDDGPFNAIGGSTATACWAVGPNGRIARFRP